MSTERTEKNGENLEILADNLKLLSSQYSMVGSKSSFLNERLEWFAKGLAEEIEQRKLGIYPDFEADERDDQSDAKAA